MKIGLTLCFKGSFHSNNLYQEIFEEIISFAPSKITINYKIASWQDSKHRRKISTLKPTDSIYIASDKGEIFSIARSGFTKPFKSITITQDITYSRNLIDLAEEYTKIPDFISGFLFDQDYVFQQSSGNESNYWVWGLSLDLAKDLPYTINHLGQKEFDITGNPGRKQLFDFSWLLAGWKMWFGEEFFKIVPKDRVLAFPDAFIVKEHPSGKVFVQLFEKLEDSWSDSAKEIQMKWRKWIDFDQLEKAYPV